MTRQGNAVKAGAKPSQNGKPIPPVQQWPWAMGKTATFCHPLTTVLLLAVVACGGKTTASGETGNAERGDSGVAGNGGVAGMDGAAFDCESFVRRTTFDAASVDLVACACKHCAALIEACAPEDCTMTCTGVNPNCPSGAVKLAGDCLMAACL